MFSQRSLKTKKITTLTHIRVLALAYISALALAFSARAELVTYLAADGAAHTADATPVTDVPLDVSIGTGDNWLQAH